MADNILSNATSQGGTAKYNYTDEIYNIRINDPKEGIVIPANMINSLEIDENMFSLLPTFKLVIEDKGSFFSGINIKNGDRIYFTITPNIEVDGKEPKPYIKGEYCVQSISCLPDLASGTYSYVIVGIYNAQSYLNQVDTYPKTTEMSILMRDDKKSDDAIREVLDDTILKLNVQCDTDDKSLWINCNDTRAQFVEKIVEHAWVGEDDAPILYTDCFGQTFYTSVKTLAAKKKIVKFENIKYYYDNLKYSGENEITMLFGDCDFLHAAGPILNQGGYKIKEAYYTPYNWTDLFEKDIEFADISFTDLLKDILASAGSDLSIIDIAIGQLIDSITKGKYRISTYSQNEPYIASRSNKASSQLNALTRFEDCGMYFKDFHSHYDLAPKHNEMIRRSFFQNFINMVVDVHRLPEEFMKAICRPVLGDKVYVDFSNSDGIDKIHSGNYIICGIKHCFKAGHAYTMQVKCVTDGTFGKGALEEDIERAKKENK